MTLGQNTLGQITGLDLFPEFINIFNRNAQQLGLADRIKGIVGSMDNLTFEKKSLDLIWSEGAIYNIGFERGLNEWLDYLKTGGYIAVSEATWFTDKRPVEIHKYGLLHFPDIDTIPNKTAVVQKAGYLPVATFILPSTCWTEHFYEPCSKIQEAFLKKHAGNKMAEELIASEIREMEIYCKYKDFYGYVFYVGKKI
jgi:SAM-dependent methyltransferase